MEDAARKQFHLPLIRRSTSNPSYRLSWSNSKVEEAQEKENWCKFDVTRNKQTQILLSLILRNGQVQSVPSTTRGDPQTVHTIHGHNSSLMLYEIQKWLKSYCVVSKGNFFVYQKNIFHYTGNKKQPWNFSIIGTGTSQKCKKKELILSTQTKKRNKVTDWLLLLPVLFFVDVWLSGDMSVTKVRKKNSGKLTAIP